MCSNTKKSIMVYLGRVGFPPPTIQKDQDKTMCISQRYAASGIMNDNVVTTAIMEYEEYEEIATDNEGPRIITLFGKKVRVLGIRRLTPTECSRLQTIPTSYKWECSDSQAYRMLGNGWTVEVIKHIFSFLPEAWKA